MSRGCYEETASVEFQLYAARELAMPDVRCTVRGLAVGWLRASLITGGRLARRRRTDYAAAAGAERSKPWTPSFAPNVGTGSEVMGRRRSSVYDCLTSPSARQRR